MKKLFATFLALTLLVGCSNGSSGTASGGDTSGGSTSGGTTTTTDDGGSAGGETIEIWLANVGGPTEWLVGKMNDWAKENNVTLNVVHPANYDETYTNLQAAIAGGVQPDLVLLDPAPARSLYSKDLVYNLTDLGLKSSDYVDAFMGQCTYDDGNAFAVPIYGTIQIGFYNVELFEKAGVDPDSINSWQDLVAVADKLKGAGATYVWEPMGGNAKNMIDAAFANGAKVFADDGETVIINSPEWVEVFEQFRKWIHEDKIMTTRWGQGWTYWYETKYDVLQNVAAGYTGSPVDPFDDWIDPDSSVDVATNFDFDTMYPREQFGWNGNPSAPWAETLVLAMPKKSDTKNQAKAFELLQYVTSPEISAGYSIISGYAASNKGAAETEEYKKYAEENPVAITLAKQAAHSSIFPADPSGQGILNALNDAASSIQQDGGTPAQEVLDKACQIAQAAVDEALGK